METEKTNLLGLGVNKPTEPADDDIYGDGDSGFDLSAASTLAEHIAVESDRLADLKSEHTRRAEALKQAKAELYDIAKAAGMDKFTTTNGLSLSLTLKPKYGRGSGVDEETFFGWLRNNNMGDIIKETVHHGTLNSAMKEFIEHGGEIDSVNIIDKEGVESEGSIINHWEEKGCRLNNKGKFLLERAKSQ